MKTKAWVVAVLVGAISSLTDLPASAQSSLSLSPSSMAVQAVKLQDVQQAQSKVRKLLNQGQYQEANVLNEKILKIIKAYFPTNQHEIAENLRYRALLYEAEGKDTEAEQTYWKVFEALNLVRENTRVISIQRMDRTGKIVNTEINVELSNDDFRNDQYIDNQVYFREKNSREISKEFLPDRRRKITDTKTAILMPKDNGKFKIASLFLLIGKLYVRTGQYEQAREVLKFGYSYYHAASSTFRMCGEMVLLEEECKKQGKIPDKHKKMIFLDSLEVDYTEIFSRLYARSKDIEDLSSVNSLASFNHEIYNAFTTCDSQESSPKENKKDKNSIKTEETIVLARMMICNLGEIPKEINKLRYQNYLITWLASQEALSQPDQLVVGRLALGQSLILKARGLDLFAGVIKTQCGGEGTQTKIRQLCDERAIISQKLSNLLFRQNQPGADLVEQYNTLLQRQKSIERDIRFAYQADDGKSAKSQLQKVDWQNVQSQLPKDGALIEIVAYRPLRAKPQFGAWWEEEHYAAAVLRPEGEPQWVNLGTAKEINALTSNLRVALSDKNDAQQGNLATVQQASRTLDQQVMAKIRPLLGNTNHLLISADGELNLVPFEALQDETGKYLIDRYQLSYLTSGRDLLRIAEAHKNPQKSRQRSVILAAPDYGSSEIQIAGGSRAASPRSRRDRSDTNVDTLSFNPLTGTRQEAEAIKAAVLPNAQLLMDGAATEAALKRIQSPNLLLIATHGFFLTNTDKFAAAPPVESGVGVGSASESPQQQVLKIENPLLRSGLALAGVNQRNAKDRPAGSDDGILTALEVAGLDLRGTQLVVLSACETGVGEAKVGDGVYGLRRALVVAGAESQVLSLWKVDDTATKDLMVSYFTKMVKEGKGRHAALQAAKQDLLKTSKYQHPYYWASFIPSGDWTPLSK